jgi:hypothetical protein
MTIDKRRKKIIIILGTILFITLGAIAIVFFLKRAQKSNLEYANYDAVLTDLINLATRAQQYYRLPVTMDGGARSFRRLYDIQRLTKYPSNPNGKYVILNCSDSTITLQGTGVERNEYDSLLQVSILVSSDTISVVADNFSRETDLRTHPADRTALVTNQKFLDEAFFKNHDHVLQDLMMLGERAQQYFRRPAMLGGGDNSFKGLDTITMISLYPTNQNGRYELIAHNDSSIILQGIGVEKTRSGSWLGVRIEVMSNTLSVIPDSAGPAPTQFQRSDERSAAFVENSIRANHDAVLNHLVMLAAKAHQYYRRPTSLGGGNGSFRNLDIQEIQRNQLPHDGTFAVTHISDSSLVLEGICKERTPDGGVIRIQMLVRPGGDSLLFDTLLK